jgi:hypothetical protein
MAFKLNPSDEKALLKLSILSVEKSSGAPSRRH